METSTNSRNLRENLSFYFNKANEEPVAINRGTDRFVLLSESEFLKMKEEMFVLQKSLISSLQIQSGEGTEVTDLEDEGDALVDEYMAKFDKETKSMSKTKKGA